jgi:RNA recognition motif-containing protein
MAGKDDCRVFVGGLAYETNDRVLGSVFGRFGKVVEAQVFFLPPKFVYFFLVQAH